MKGKLTILLLGFVLIASGVAFGQHGSGSVSGHQHANMHQGVRVSPAPAPHRYTQEPARGNFHERMAPNLYTRRFGREHTFFLHQWFYRPGWNHFWYGGFYFGFWDPWPAEWCYCDDFYVAYDETCDGYFMYNVYHPGLRLQLFW